MLATKVLAVPDQTVRPQTVVTSSKPNYNVSIGYLRAFITLMVVAHHAMLAYHPFAPAVPASLTAVPRLWQAFPVIDAQRSTLFSVLVSFNDVFFMALMFFLSGMFVWDSLRRKGVTRFVRDRALRLGVPFLMAAAVIAPLAYYPTYIQSQAVGGEHGFWRQWFALGNWPAGPAWFVWVLLAFDAVAALLLIVMPNWGTWLARLTASAERRPIVFFGLLLLLSVAAYVPLALVFSPFRWSAWGSFAFQTSRGLHYLVYFLLGVGIGAFGLDRGLLAREGKLARRWWLWCLAALFAFGFAITIGLAALTAHLGSRGWEIAGDSSFVLSCAASSFAFLALFVRFARTRGQIWDSLTANAYGIYLIHYAFVSWLQLSLLKSHLPAIAKGALVTVAAASFSWGVTAALRRIPAIKRVI